MTRVTAGTSAYGSPAARTNSRPREADLAERLIDRHRRLAHHVLVVDVGDDADDAARLRLPEIRIGPPHVAVQRLAVRKQPLRHALADDDDQLVAAAVARR